MGVKRAKGCPKKRKTRARIKFPDKTKLSVWFSICGRPVYSKRKCIKKKNEDNNSSSSSKDESEDEA